MQITDTTTEYHKVRQEQSLIIEGCLNHLESIGIHHEYDFTRFDAAAEYRAWEFCKKHWAKFKSAGIPWIKAQEYKSHYAVESRADDKAIVKNLSKDESHTLLWQDQAWECDCDAYHFSGGCAHVDFALEELDEPPVEISASATVTIEDSAKQAFFDLIDKSMASEKNSRILAETNADEILPGIIGTKDQVRVVSELVEFVQGAKQIHSLVGPAGSGKSTVLQAAIAALRQNNWSGRIALTAPTNKATGVLQSMVDRWGLGIECQTCARLLGLKPRIDADGNQYFEPDSKEDSTIGDFDLIIIDEASMVGSETGGRKGLWEYLTESATFFTKLLFVGDYCQLPPVNEPISQVFLSVINPSWLNEVKRYDGSIAVLADRIRRNLASQAKPLITTDITADKTKGIFLLTKKAWKDAMLSAFNSDGYKLDPNRVRCLAWTNKRVAQWNRHIRDGIYGGDVDYFQSGDRLIAKLPFARQYMGDYEGFHTSAEMEVLTAVEGYEGNYKAWHLTCQLFDHQGTRITIPVLHEESKERFKEDQAKLREAKQHFKYHDNIQAWAWVEHAYAITIHNAQGSTYRDVFVDLKDIRQDTQRNVFTWPNGQKELIWERNQLLYVALTRATHRVFVYK